MLALAFFALWLLWRSHRDLLARALPEHREVEVAATLCALICGAQIFVATFIAPTMFGFWFPGRYLIAALPPAVALVAWGLRHAPRVGAALVAVTLVTSVWWYLALRIDGGAIVGPSSRAPLGPLDAALPAFGRGRSAPPSRWRWWPRGSSPWSPSSGVRETHRTASFLREHRPGARSSAA